jgi:hypothetical protein
MRVGSRTVESWGVSLPSGISCGPASRGLESLRPDQWEALLEDVDLQARVRREWKPPFGPFPPDIRAFLQRALQLYGPGNDGIHGERVAGTVTIINGRHRSCAAFQQGIGVAATVAQEQTRLDPMASERPFLRRCSDTEGFLVVFGWGS